VPPRGYLQRLREICDRHGILLVFDEVICGFGRAGAAFGAQAFGVTPDIMTMAKGLTNGAIPMGAVAVKGAIYETIVEKAPPGTIEFFHGYTYSAHPVACAAALAALELYRRDGVFARAASLSGPFLDRIFGLGGLPGIADIRGYGMLAAIDLVPADRPGDRGYRAMLDLYAQGVLARIAADTIILSPPLIAEESHLDRIAEAIRVTLGRV
jgi:beta-alanine--pyruvate transaminase